MYTTPKKAVSRSGLLSFLGWRSPGPALASPALSPRSTPGPSNARSSSPRSPWSPTPARVHVRIPDEARSPEYRSAQRDRFRSADPPAGFYTELPSLSLHTPNKPRARDDSNQTPRTRCAPYTPSSATPSRSTRRSSERGQRVSRSQVQRQNSLRKERSLKSLERDQPSASGSGGGAVPFQLGNAPVHQQQQQPQQHFHSAPPSVPAPRDYVPPQGPISDDTLTVFASATFPRHARRVNDAFAQSHLPLSEEDLIFRDNFQKLGQDFVATVKVIDKEYAEEVAPAIIGTSAPLTREERNRAFEEQLEQERVKTAERMALHEERAKRVAEEWEERDRAQEVARLARDESKIERELKQEMQGMRAVSEERHRQAEEARIRSEQEEVAKAAAVKARMEQSLARRERVREAQLLRAKEKAEQEEKAAREYQQKLEEARQLRDLEIRKNQELQEQAWARDQLLKESEAAQVSAYERAAAEAEARRVAEERAAELKENQRRFQEEAKRAEILAMEAVYRAQVQAEELARAQTHFEQETRKARLAAQASKERLQAEYEERLRRETEEWERKYLDAQRQMEEELRAWKAYQLEHPYQPQPLSIDFSMRAASLASIRDMSICSLVRDASMASVTSVTSTVSMDTIRGCDDSGPMQGIAPSRPPSPPPRVSTPPPADFKYAYKPQNEAEWLHLYDQNWSRIRESVGKNVAQLPDFPRGGLTFAYIPWPTFQFISDLGSLNEEHVHDFFSKKNPTGNKRQHYAELLKWHTDKFGLIRGLIHKHCYEDIQQGFEVVVRVLNSMTKT